MQPVVFDPAGLRVGQGYDVHAFAEGRKLILGGVDVPHVRGLLGHSDADVLAHAISDALLGGIRGGDIGKLFPDTDPAYKDADSLKLLAAVADKVRAEGYVILDVDSVIAAQAPKLSPYREAMRENLAAAMGIAVENGVIVGTPDRRVFWNAQTPQVFRAGIYRRAHASALSDGFMGTDDSSLIERLGGRVLVVEGKRDNIKLTVPEDYLMLAAAVRTMYMKGAEE